MCLFSERWRFRFNNSWESGMLVEAGDADAIFQTLKQLISDTKQLGRMKVLAREAVKNYSWNTYDSRISW